jgi:hypothetical protein
MGQVPRPDLMGIQAGYRAVHRFFFALAYFLGYYESDNCTCDERPIQN